MAGLAGYGCAGVAVDAAATDCLGVSGNGDGVGMKEQVKGLSFLLLYYSAFWSFSRS